MAREVVFAQLGTVLIVELTLASRRRGRTRLWEWPLFAVMSFFVCFSSQAESTKSAKSTKRIVLPFPTLHRKVSEFGNKPRSLWTYGRFTAWSPVREGVFAAGFPKLLSHTALQKIAPYVVFPTEPLVQIAICETGFPIPGLKEGRDFEIAEDKPAEVLEMLQANCFYVRLRLSAAPKPLWEIKKTEKGDQREAQTARQSEQGTLEEGDEGEEPASASEGRRTDAEARPPRRNAGEWAKRPMLLHFADIARAWKKKGSRPARTWTYGRFFVDSDVQNGLFIAHESGLATRRAVEGLLASAVIFPFGERYDTAIFTTRLRHLDIHRKSVIEIDKSHPARVLEIASAGGLLVRLDLEEEPAIEGLGGSHGAGDFFSPVIRLFSR
ncbi:MAG: hypothetical protein AB7T14_04280 [Candidatus Methylacidiphilaceae bacterium]